MKDWGRHRQRTKGKTMKEEDTANAMEYKKQEANEEKPMSKCSMEIERRRARIEWNEYTTPQEAVPWRVNVEVG